jgi:hypothetical protein
MKFLLLGDTIAHNIDEAFLRKAISPHIIEIPGSDICFYKSALDFMFCLGNLNPAYNCYSVMPGKNFYFPESAFQTNIPPLMKHFTPDVLILQSTSAEIHQVE